MKKSFETWKVLNRRSRGDCKKSTVLPDAAHLIRLVCDQPIEQEVELVRVSSFELGMQSNAWMSDVCFTHMEVCQAGLAAGLRLCHPRIGFWLAAQWVLDTSYTVLAMEPVMTWSGGWADHEASVLEFLRVGPASGGKSFDSSVLTAARVNYGDKPIYTRNNLFVFQK